MSPSFDERPYIETFERQSTFDLISININNRSRSFERSHSVEKPSDCTNRPRHPSKNTSSLGLELVIIPIGVLVYSSIRIPGNELLDNDQIDA